MPSRMISNKKDSKNGKVFFKTASRRQSNDMEDQCFTSVIRQNRITHKLGDWFTKGKRSMTISRKQAEKMLSDIVHSSKFDNSLSTSHDFNATPEQGHGSLTNDLGDNSTIQPKKSDSPSDCVTVEDEGEYSKVAFLEEAADSLFEGYPHAKSLAKFCELQMLKAILFENEEIHALLDRGLRGHVIQSIVSPPSAGSVAQITGEEDDDDLQLKETDCDMAPVPPRPPPPTSPPPSSERQQHWRGQAAFPPPQPPSPPPLQPELLLQQTASGSSVHPYQPVITITPVTAAAGFDCLMTLAGAGASAAASHCRSSSCSSVVPSCCPCRRTDMLCVTGAGGAQVATDTFHGPGLPHSGAHSVMASVVQAAPSAALQGGVAATSSAFSSCYARSQVKQSLGDPATGHFFAAPLLADSRPVLFLADSDSQSRLQGVSNLQRSSLHAPGSQHSPRAQEEEEEEEEEEVVQPTSDVELLFDSADQTFHSGNLGNNRTGEYFSDLDLAHVPGAPADESYFVDDPLTYLLDPRVDSPIGRHQNDTLDSCEYSRPVGIDLEQEQSSSPTTTGAAALCRARAGEAGTRTHHRPTLALAVSPSPLLFPKIRMY